MLIRPPFLLPWIAVSSCIAVNSSAVSAEAFPVAVQIPSPTSQATASQSDVSVLVHSLDSQEVISASWIELSVESLAVNDDGSARSLAVGNLQMLHFPRHTADQQRSSGLIVQLRDGSRISPERLSSNGQTIAMHLDDRTTVEVRVAQTHSIQLQPMTPAQQNQWEAILDSRIAADTLVLVRTAESVDKIEGVIGEIQPESVQFEYGGQVLNAPRTKLAGLRFFSPPATLPSTVCSITDVWGNVWQAAQVTSAKGLLSLEIVLTCGAAVTLPLETISLLDFSSGSMLYVATIDPISQGRNSAFDLDVSVAGMDQLFGAQPIQLPKTNGPSLKFLGGGWVVYRIPSDYTMLTGRVFLAPSGSRYTPCRVLIKLENQVLWEQQLTELSQQLEFSVPVEAEKRLRIEVSASTHFPVGDVVVWKELRLIK